MSVGISFCDACYSYDSLVVVVVVVVVVLTLTRRIKSVVTGQAPVTLELRNIPGKTQRYTSLKTFVVV